MAVGGKVNFEVDNGRSIRQRENCEMCDKTEHDGYCSRCEIHVCQICFDNHIKSKFCRDHVLLHDTDRCKNQSSGARFDTCLEHKLQEVRLYCTEHKCCGCAECILVGHSSCKWEYIVEASNRFQDSGDLVRLLEDVQSLEYTLDKYIEVIDEHKTTTEKINKDVVSDIETFAKSLVEYIAGSKQQALDDAKVRNSAHQQKLDKLKLDIQSLGKQVEEIITDFRDEDILHKRFILAVETMPKVARIQNEIAAFDCNNVITDYKFRPGNFLKRMMSTSRPIGKLIDAGQIEEDEEDDEYIQLKKERERSQDLDQQLKENQKMMSKLKKDVHDMEQTYGRVVKDKKCLDQEICTLKSENQNVVSKLNKDINDLKKNYDNLVSKLNKDLGDVKQNYDRAVKEKQSLELQIDAQKSSNQNVVSKLNKDIVDTKQKYEEIISKMKQELDDVKLHGPAITLSCEHENLVGHFGENKLITCRTCGIINGDQPNGTLTTEVRRHYIALIFTFPKGTQSKLSRNPGQRYSGKTVTAFLRNDLEGNQIQKMMNIAFERKSMFTIDNHGYIKNGVELLTDESYCCEKVEKVEKVKVVMVKNVPQALNVPMVKEVLEYIARVKKQLEERGIKESDVTQL